MKRFVLLTAAIWALSGCASDHPQYTREQFTNASYQQNVVNAIDYADNYVDFDQESLPKADLEVQDFSLLLQADLAFNQGSYSQAGETYYYLANKYQDPRIVYKGIVCFEHSSAAPDQFTKLNQLINLMIEKAPDSKVSKLFGIRVALEKDDVDTAKSNLKYITTSDPTKTRAVLLFLSTIISNDTNKGSDKSLEEFAKYVENKYGSYPEAYLYTTVTYSITANQDKLFDSLDKVYQNYPNWEVPVYWSAGILIKHENLRLLQLMLNHEINRYQDPSGALQNLYIASLIRSDKLDAANSYIESSLQKTPGDGNLLVNSAVLDYKRGLNQDAINSLSQAKAYNYTLNGSVDFALASLYDYDDKKESAVTLYQNVAKTNPLLSPAANMGIFRLYAESKQYKQSDAFIESLVKTAKLNSHDAAIFKISLYTSLGDFNYAYGAVSQNIDSYKNDKTFVYLYASLSGLTNRTEQAIKWYNKYIKMSPNDPTGYNDLGFIYADKTLNYIRARDLAEKAYRMVPNDLAVLDTLGWAYYKLGQYAKAETYLEQAYRMTQDHDTAVHLREVYLADKKMDKAAKVIIMNPQVEKLQFKQTMLNQAMSILMYYQYGLDLSR